MSKVPVLMPPIIDIEASGFGRGSYPIEVGFCLENGDIQHHLIRPEPDWVHWDLSAEQVHGITREHLVKEGLSIREIAMCLNQALQGRILYSDAWGFDVSWLGRLFDRVGVMQRFSIDTLQKLLTSDQMERWHEVKVSVMMDLKLIPHRVASDVRVLQETYRRVSKSL